VIDYRFKKNVLVINPSPESRSISDITYIIDKIRPESHAIIWQPWEESDSRFDEYLKHDYKEIPNHPENIFEFENTLLKHNIKCYLLVGSDYSNAYSNIKTNPIKNFEVLFWPTALLHYTYHGMVSFYGKKPSELFNRFKPIDKLYLNLNNNDRNHRGMFMDLLCKFDLFHYGINSWNSETYSWDFKYFKPQKLIFDDFDKKLNHIPQRVFSEKLLNAPNLIDVITETSPILEFFPDSLELNKEYIFHTEKTFRSILFGKPFLILGNKGQTMNLKKYGIALFDNIFDYKYDNSDSFRSRGLGIIDNLYEFRNKNFGEVRDTIINLSVYNIDRATAIVYNDEYMPTLLKKIVEENKDEYEVLLRDFDANYSGSFGIPDEWRLTENIFKEIYQ
jgi:hypothetical protein